MRDDHEQLQKKMEKHEHNKKLAAEHNDEINDEISDETKTLEEKSDTIVQAAATAGSIAHLRISRARANHSCEPAPLRPQSQTGQNWKPTIFDAFSI